MRQLRVGETAADEIDAILEDSERRFGALASDRYRFLIEAALSLIGADPHRAATSEMERRGRAIRRMHLRSARLHVIADDRVGRPRHYVYFEIFDDRILVLRIVHDARDQTRLRFPRR